MLPEFTQQEGTVSITTPFDLNIVAGVTVMVNEMPTAPTT